jgi:hypothetical protein
VQGSVVHFSVKRKHFLGMSGCIPSSELVILTIVLYLAVVHVFFIHGFFGLFCDRG